MHLRVHFSLRYSALRKSEGFVDIFRCMECGDYEREYAEKARGASGVGLQLNFNGSRYVSVARSRRVPGQSSRSAFVWSAAATRASELQPPADGPFINDMDEISYWIYTKRAPCLMNYDKLIRKRSEEAQCSKTVMEELASPRKKKKRKLSMLDEDSVSTQKQQNVYFEVTPKQILPRLNTCKSESLGSHLDFNITSTTVGEKARLQKKSTTRIYKKPKLVTSTPKPPVNLRRSLRRTKQSSSNAHLNSSFEIFNSSVISNGHIKNNINQKPQVNKTTQMFAAGDGDQTAVAKRTVKNKSKPTAMLNGVFEDLSDVSGFTANYIRSTKVQSGKTLRKLRCKTGRNLVKESQQGSTRKLQRSENIVVCINKSINTEVPNANIVNCSTDSSQNVMNLITTRSHDKSGKIDKSTSLLKFVNTKSKSKDDVLKHIESKPKSNSNLNISYQSQSSGASRYPKRYKNHMDTHKQVNTRTRAANKNCLHYNNSDKKENPVEAAISRTRSGRNTSLMNPQQANSVLVMSNSTEQVSSLASMNVASPMATDRRKKTVRSKKVNNKSDQSLRKNSMREKSGFTACFSDSDDDSVPLVQRKYFCN